MGISIALDFDLPECHETSAHNIVIFVSHMEAATPKAGAATPPPRVAASKPAHRPANGAIPQPTKAEPLAIATPTFQGLTWDDGTARLLRSIDTAAALHRSGPLSQIPMDQDLFLRRQSSMRQLETIEILIHTESRKLTDMEAAARSACEAWHLRPRIERAILDLDSDSALTKDGSSQPISETTKKDLLEQCLLGLTFAGTNPAASSAIPGDNPNTADDDKTSDVTGPSAAVLHRFPMLEWFAHIPPFLLNDDELPVWQRVTAVIEETRDQILLLETIQAHEVQLLDATEDRIEKLTAAMQLANKESSCLLDGRSQSHGNSRSKRSASRANSEDPAGSTSSSCSKVRPPWVQYFALSKRPEDDGRGFTDDQRCCVFIEELLDRTEAALSATEERNAAVDAWSRKCAALERERDALRQEKSQAEECLTISNERCQELVQMVENAQNEIHALQCGRWLVSMRTLVRDEEHSRNAVCLEAQLRHSSLEASFWKDTSAAQRQLLAAYEDALEAEQVVHSDREQEMMALLHAQREAEDAATNLREEVAAVAADRAVMVAKVELLQQNLRGDAERFARQLESKDQEIAMMREKLIDQEARLDVLSSTSVSRQTASKASNAQLLWDKAKSTSRLQHFSPTPSQSASAGATRIALIPTFSVGSTTTAATTSDRSASALLGTRERSPKPRATLPPKPTS